MKIADVTRDIIAWQNAHAGESPRYWIIPKRDWLDLDAEVRRSDSWRYGLPGSVLGAAWGSQPNILIAGVPVVPERELTEQEKDVIAVARARLAECRGGEAPGAFMLGKEDAALWLRTIVHMAEIIADREHSTR